MAQEMMDDAMDSMNDDVDVTENQNVFNFNNNSFIFYNLLHK